LRNLSKALAQKGHTANKGAISRMLKEFGYGLQADKKTLTVKPSHPDRDM
jgi:arginine repressor